MVMPVCQDCLCESCTISSDTFPGPTLGGNWEVRSGTWENIAATSVDCTASPGLIVDVAEEPGAVRAAAKIRPLTGSPNRSRVIVCYEDDDNYLFAELAETGTCDSVRLGERFGGSETWLTHEVPLGSVTTTAGHLLAVCWTPAEYPEVGRLQATVITDTDERRYLTALVAAPPAGDRAGLAVVSGTTRFSDWVYNRLGVVNGVTCATCGGPGCTYFEDQFNGTDTTDLGCNWLVISGSWDRFGNKLRCLSPGKIICLVPQPYGNTRFTTAVKPTTEPTKWRILSDWIDVDNHHAYEMDFTSGSVYKYYKIEGGTSTNFNTITGGITEPVPARDANGFSLCLQRLHHFRNWPSESLGGVLGGIEVISQSSSSTFDAFKLQSEEPLSQTLGDCFLNHEIMWQCWGRSASDNYGSHDGPAMSYKVVLTRVSGQACCASGTWILTPEQGNHSKLVIYSYEDASIRLQLEQPIGSGCNATLSITQKGCIGGTAFGTKTIALATRTDDSYSCIDVPFTGVNLTFGATAVCTFDALVTAL